LASEIAQLVQRNTVTLSVAQQELRAVVQSREDFLTHLHELQFAFTALGIELHDLKEGEAEIGFLLPRSLFNNHLDRLIQELGTIQKIIRAFSEVVTGSPEAIEIKQISTSDPLFFFGVSTTTIAALGLAATWALNTWKQVEEINQIRAQTAQIEQMKDTPFQKLLDEQIKTIVAAEVAKKVEELIKQSKADDGRKNEQEAHLTWALNSIFSRVERGMTIEIKILPPTHEELDPAEGFKPSTEFTNLREITSQLVFPEMKGTPVTQLPPPIPIEEVDGPPENPTSSSKRSKATPKS